jgi:ribonuclease E
MTQRFEADLEAVARTAAEWCGEPFLHEGEDAALALAPGSVRRAALDAALAEMARGELAPSFAWRRDYALVLGLERVLSEAQPKLASGTTLRRHQVDALAGQLAALIGDLQRPEEATEEDDDEPDGDEDAPPIEAEDTAPEPSDGVLEGEFAFDDEDFEDEDEDEDDEQTLTDIATRFTR